MSKPAWIYGVHDVPATNIGSGQHVQTPNGMLQCTGVERWSHYVRLVFAGGYTWTMDSASYVKRRNALGVTNG